MNETIRTIYERRAVRKYKDVPLTANMVEQLLDSGRMAPSAIDKQPWRFYVMTNTTLIKSIGKEIAVKADEYFHLAHGIHISQTEDTIFYGAPLVVFISAPRDSEWAQLDIGMCAQNMMLAAKSLGLDSCPVGFGKFVEKTNSYATLQVPPSEHIIISLIFGYGNEHLPVKERKKDNVIYIS